MKWTCLIISACLVFSNQERLINADSDSNPTSDATTEAILSKIQTATDDYKLLRRSTTTLGPRHDIFAPNFKCTPDEKFINSEGCSCTCRASGRTAYCDRDDCQITIAHYIGKQRFKREEPLPQLNPTLPGFQCTPNQSFKFECNRCKCSEDGRSAACTQRACLRKREIESDRTLDPGATDFKCIPGEMFRHVDGCNKCLCDDSGTKARCSQLICGLPPSIYRDEEKIDQQTRVRRSDLLSLPNLDPTAPDFSCTPGESFRHDCNRCTCGTSGKLAKCTLRLCSPEPQQTAVSTERRKRADDDLLSLPNLDPTASDFSCTPGESFRVDCNRCSCVDGKRASCTRKFCIPASPPTSTQPTERKRRSTDDRRTLNPDSPDFSCDPNESFKHIDGCNDCTCLPDGKLARCTLKLCPEPVTREQRSDLYSLRNLDPNAPDFSCTPGEQFRADCNRCTCGSSGKLARCTLKLCPPESESSPAQRRKRADDLYSLPNLNPNAKDFSCTPGEQFRHDCNRCTCGTTGRLAACTFKLCPTEPQQTRALTERPERSGADLPELNPNSKGFQCTPGSAFRDECNTCTCNEDGRTAACTLKLCLRKKRADDDQVLPILDPQSPNFSCEPGKSFRHIDQCNFCTCSSNGKLARCTAKLCPENEQQFVTREKRSEPPMKTLDPSVDNFSCTPGETFKHIDGCNHCFCTGDGKSAGCTLMGCNIHRVPLKPTEDVKIEKDLNREKRSEPAIKIFDPSVDNFSCTSGETFKHIDGCNTCSCSDGGRPLCTKIGCLTFPLPTQAAEARRKRETPTQKTLDPNADGFSCTPGEGFNHVDGCNTCVCSNDGKYAGCTLKLCLSKREVHNETPEATTHVASEPVVTTENPVSTTTSPPKACKPGESYYDGCNWCSCGEDGKPHYCTLKYCFTIDEANKFEVASKSIGAEEEQTKESDKDNDTGARKKREVIYKDPTAPNFSCSPGAQFYHADGCNTCLCGSNGKTAACTLRQCLNAPTTTPQPGSLPSIQTCVPGSKFLSDDGCNTCTCSADGKQVGCTLMYCEQKTTPAPIGFNSRPASTGLGNMIADRIQTMTQNNDRLVFARQTREVPDGEEDLPQYDVNAADFSCQPRESFKDKCNFCTCGPDGKSARCTDAACP